MNYVDLFGYAAGILVVVYLIPQVIKSWRTKSTKDLSLFGYIIYVIGIILWIIYAILIQNGPVAVMNGIALILAVTMLYLKLKYG